MICALLYDIATGATLQRMRVPLATALDAFPVEAGQAFAIHDGAEPLDHVETALVGGEVVIVPRAVDTDVRLAIARVQKWSAAKAYRDQRVNGGCSTAAGRIDSDEASRGNLNGAVAGALLAQATGASFAVAWTMADNSTVELDAAQLLDVGRTVLAHVDACHTAARLVRAAIEAASDDAALAAIDITAGYPPT